jgi:predicted dehydrogenase
MAFASATATNLARFVGLIAAGSRDDREVRHARNLIRLVFAGYESADRGQTVTL